MEVFSLLKFWRNPSGGSDDVNVSNPGLEVDEDTSNLVVTGPQNEFDKVSTKNKYSSTTSVGVTSFDNDTKKQHIHKIFSERDGQAKPSAHNGNVFSIQKLLPLETNFKSQSPILVLRSSPKNCVSLLGFKKSDKTDLNGMSCSTVTPKIKESKKSMEEVKNTLDSSSSKYLKMIKPLCVKALKIRIFDQSVSENYGEKEQGSRPAVLREVCKSLMKSKSSVKPVSVPAKRRDDSALQQQQDGIQSAILYCKRSYSSSSSSSLSTISQECTGLSRSASACSYQNEAINPPIISK